MKSQTPVIAVNEILNRVLDRGSRVLYNTYLTSKLPDHSSVSTNQFVKDMVEDGIRPPETNQAIQRDQDKLRMSQDNFAPRSVSMSRRGQKTSHSPSRMTERLRSSLSNYFGSKKDSRSQTNERQRPSQTFTNRSSLARTSDNPPSAKKKYVATIPKSSVVPLKGYRVVLSQQERLYQQHAQRYRRRRAYMKNIQREAQLSESMKKKQAQAGYERLRRYKQEVQKNSLAYTYDFQGRILLCDPINKKRSFRVDNLCTQVKGHVLKLNKPKHQQQINSQRTKKHPNTNGDVFKSLLNMSILEKDDAMKQLGSNFSRNEIFNNNNCRQTTSIPLVRLSTGVVMNEPQGNMGSISGNPFDETRRFNRTQFISSIHNEKFKSFISNNDNSNNNEAGEDGDFNKKLYSTSVKFDTRNRIKQLRKGYPVSIDLVALKS